MKLGVVCSNDQWAPWSSAALQALEDLAPQTLEVLVFGPDNPLEDTRIAQAEDYVHRHPGTELLLRPYMPNIPLWDPEQWAETAWRWCGNWRFAPFSVISDNERNLPVEGGSEDWAGHVAWLRAFVAHWRHLCDWPIDLGALSPSGRYKDGWSFYADCGIYGLFDRVNVHVYDLAQVSDAGQLKSIAGRPVAITEFNRIAPSDLAQACGPVADAAYWFILDGTPDWRPYDLIGSKYYSDFKATAAALRPKGAPTMDEVTQQAMIEMEAKQNTLLTEALKRLRQGKFEGADGIDGLIVALQGGKPLDFTPSYPPKA